MRPPILRLHTDELIVDSFAGGGGASTGIERALGRSPDIAINHDREALAMHRVNHPNTEHYCEDIWKVDPVKATGGRPVGLAWFSPDCTHHSRARGGKPRKKKIRGLAWVVTRWARAVRPRVICLENVEEYAEWGPLTADGKPCKRRKGQTFEAWKGQLERMGYEVQYRPMRACDYGAPTSRRRLFLVARRDGMPIVWPSATHGDSPLLGLAPYRTAAECIDWSLPCPSIFERKKPLADKTLARIARGIRRYVLEASDPFVVPVAGDAAAPTLIQTGYGEREGQKPRALDLHQPLGTVVGGGQKHALVAAFLARHFGGNENDGAPLTRPMHTVTAKDHHALVTVSAGGDHREQVRAFLMAYYGTGQGRSPKRPMATITAKDRFAVVTVHGVEYAIADIGMRMLAPRELYTAQGFGPDYEIETGLDEHGQPVAFTKTAQVRMVGNSVSPPAAQALVQAQFLEQGGEVAA